MTHKSARAAALAPCLAFLAVVAVLAGCSPGSAPLAKVGDKTITAEEFERAAQGNALQYPAEPNTAKAMLLEDLVRREMMLRASRDHGSDSSTYARAHRADLEERTLLQALYDQLGPRDVAVSEGEARAFWAMRNTEADASIIYAIDGNTARGALGMLSAGMPFETVADQINSPGVVPPGGRLGPVTPGSLLPPLDAALLSQPLGQVGGPYETPQGWFLMRVNNRRPRRQAGFEEQSSSLSEIIRQRKNRQALANGVSGLKQAYHLAVSTGAPQQLFRVIGGLVQGGSPPPASELKANVLATWDGGKYTLDQAIADLQRSDRPKPQASNVSALATWIEGQGTLRIALAEAKRRHLGEDVDVARRLRNEWEQYLLEGEYAAATIHVGNPSPAEVAAAYEQVKSQFTVLQQANVVWIADADSAKAFAVARHAGHGGGTLKEAVAMADPSMTAHEESITFPSTDPRWASMQTRFSRMQPNEFTGPEPSADGWRIVQLIDKKQESMPFEKLPEQVKQSLTSRLYEMAREKAFNAYADSLKAVMKPIPVPENLARVRWPSAGATTALPPGLSLPQ